MDEARKERVQVISVYDIEYRTERGRLDALRAARDGEVAVQGSSTAGGSYCARRVSTTIAKGEQDGCS